MTRPSDKAPARVLYYLEEVMGTVVVFDLWVDATLERDLVDSLLHASCATLHRAEELLSPWKSDSPISRLRHGDATLDQMPDDVLEVLARCADARDISRGWFDPWAMPGGVNPTGYVKGWAAQRALKELEHAGIIGAMVNAAGDIATQGAPGVGVPFRIGISDPRERGRLACVVDVVGAIATSGSYEQGEHLIDPRSGQPVSRAASASVTGPDLGLADALATALAVAGHEFLEVLEGIEGYQGLVIEWDGSLACTTRFPFVPDSPGVSAATTKAATHPARK